MESSNLKIPKVTLLGWLLVLFALLYAGLVANGDVFPRTVLVIPLLALGSIFCGVGQYTSQNVKSGSGWGAALVVSLVTAYFISRAALSPVWDLARKDIVLVAAGAMAFFSASTALQYRVARTVLLIAVGGLLLCHGIFSLIQLVQNPSFAFLGRYRVDQVGVSGAYYHRNYFAGFLAHAGAIFLAVMLSSLRGSFKWLMWFSVLLVITILAYLTGSRGGFVTLVLGMIFVLTMSFPSVVAALPRTPWVKVTGGAIVGVAGIVGWQLFKGILERRNDVWEALGVRFEMAGVAASIWENQPLWGEGSRSFSYLYPRHASGVYLWSGDANLVHSEYLQSLSDYGVVGLVGILLLIITISFYLAVYGGSKGMGCWLVPAAGGLMLVEATRAVFDFNLHILPNLLLFAIVLGGGLSVMKGESEEGGGKRIRKEKILKLVQLFSVVSLAAISLWTGRREILASPLWFRFESARLQGRDGSEVLRSFTQEAPSFEALRTVARNSLKRSARVPNEEARLLAAEDWGRVIERHRYDGESLANFARALDDLEDFRQAEDFHREALEAVGQRENQYGVIFGVGWHLAKRAQQAQKGRRPGEALFLYQQALEAFEVSFQRHFSRGEFNPKMREAVRAQIQFLQDARIDPVQVKVLEWQTLLPQ